MRKYYFFPTLRKKDIHKECKYLSINLDTGIFFIPETGITVKFSGIEVGREGSSAPKKSAWMVRWVSWWRKGGES